MTESRSLSVPPGRAGERVDVALATLLGFSRTQAAEIADAGGVSLDGRVDDHDGAILLGFGGRCAQVRHGDDLGRAEQVHRRKVADVATHGTGLETLTQCRRVDDAFAGEVEQDDAPAHHL